MAAPNPDHVRTLDFRASADGQAADTNAPWAMVGGRPRYRPRRQVRPPAPPVEDAAGHDLRPNPLAASTAAELLTALRALRVWGGKPGCRVMAMRAGHRAAPSTLCTALKSVSLPSLDVVRALVEGAGGSKEDVKLYATAWRQIKMAEEA